MSETYIRIYCIVLYKILFYLKKGFFQDKNFKNYKSPEISLVINRYTQAYPSYSVVFKTPKKVPDTQQELTIYLEACSLATSILDIIELHCYRWPLRLGKKANLATPMIIVPYVLYVYISTFFFDLMIYITLVRLLGLTVRSFFFVLSEIKTSQELNHMRHRE